MQPDADQRVLLIDDDVELCELVSEYLSTEGFRVDVLHDGLQGVLEALRGRHLLVILDVMLPGLNGLEVLRRIRAESSLPVVMLTARGDDVDRIVGLEIGADDYLPKPFNPRELVARLRAVLRRTQPAGTDLPPPGPAAPVRVADVELEPAARLVRRGGETVELTAVEFDLLEILLRGAGRALGREELVRQVLGRVYNPFDRSIDMHVSHLRKKLGPHPDGAPRIRTVRSVGYIYTLPGRPEGGTN